MPEWLAPLVVGAVVGYVGGLAKARWIDEPAQSRVTAKHERRTALRDMANALDGPRGKIAVVLTPATDGQGPSRSSVRTTLIMDLAKFENEWSRHWSYIVGPEPEIGDQYHAIIGQVPAVEVWADPLTDEGAYVHLR